jgi:hypothetical protein
MLWTGEQTPSNCGTEEKVDTRSGTGGTPIKKVANVEMWQQTNVDAKDEATKVAISDVEVETVASMATLIATSKGWPPRGAREATLIATGFGFYFICRHTIMSTDSFPPCITD